MTDDEILATEAWEAFEDMRKAKGKRAPFTELAKKRILFELRRLGADGQDIEEVLWTSVTNAWSGVFPIKRVGWHAPTVAVTVPSKAINQTQDYFAREAAHAELVKAQALARKQAKEQA